MGKLASSLLWDNAANSLNDPSLPILDLSNATVLVTGSTGLIGSQLVRTLLKANEQLGLNLTLILPVRNCEKATALFGARSENELQLIPWQLGEELPAETTFTHAVHGASTTASADFKNRPVEVILDSISGTAELLRAAHRCNASRFVFLSSMEVYGEVTGIAHEANLGVLDSLSTRNSYPGAKRLSETLCASYWEEYGLSTSIVRLAQTFGAGATKDDKRVFAEFGRCAISGANIELITDGSKKNPYVSIDDAVRAILFVLAKGAPGQAYNVANEATYCSVKEMAELVLEEFGTSSSRVIRKIDASREGYYPKSSDLKMDCSAIRALGWQAEDSLQAMYEKMLAFWNNELE